MRKFSPLVTSLISSGIYSGFYLLSLDVGNPSLKYTTLPYDVVVDGVTYTADNTLAGLDPPKLSSNTDREAFKISFSDPQFQYSALCRSMMNAKVTVRGGFFNTTGGVVFPSSGLAVDVNEPILSSADMITLYSGYIDVVRYTIDDENGVILELECASPMASLDALSVFYSTTNSLKQRVPAAVWASSPDTAFDNVSLGGRSQEILWGKI